MAPKKRPKYDTQKCCNGTERCTGRGEKHACMEPTDAAVVVRTRVSPSPKTVQDTIRATDEVLARAPSDEKEAEQFIARQKYLDVWDPRFKDALTDLIAKVRVSTERRLRTL